MLIEFHHLMGNVQMSSQSCPWQNRWVHLVSLLVGKGNLRTDLPDVAHGKAIINISKLSPESDPCIYIYILSIKNGHISGLRHANFRLSSLKVSNDGLMATPTLLHCAMPLAFLSFLIEVQRGINFLSPKQMMILEY